MVQGKSLHGTGVSHSMPDELGDNEWIRHRVWQCVSACQITRTCCRHSNETQDTSARLFKLTTYTRKGAQSYISLRSGCDLWILPIWHSQQAPFGVHVFRRPIASRDVLLSLIIRTLPHMHRDLEVPFVYFLVLKSTCFWSSRVLVFVL